MALQLETDKITPDITVVRVSGSMTFEEADTVLSLIVALLDRGVKKLIMDLSGVAHIDRVGGISLVRCFFAAREAKVDLCMAGASPCVTRLFQPTHVDSLIPFFATIAAAREHFSNAPRAGAKTA